MDEKEAQHILIEILYSAINEVEDREALEKKITPEILLSVCRLAKKHDLSYIVSSFVSRAGIEVDRELQAKLQQEEIVSVYRYEQMQYAFGEICRAFDEAEIAYIPLKGSVIRPFYPCEEMRTSCDIDILIHEEDLRSAINCLEEKGFRCGDREYHDVSLFSPNNVHLELHFSIQENMENLDAVLKDAWRHTAPIGGSRHAFSEEFFAFHIYAHMAYHFVSGGCGMRSLLDIWVIEHRMGISHSHAKELLQKAGIYQFASEMSELAERCFTRNDIDSFSDTVLTYIFQGGVYGSTENHIAVDKSKTGGLAGYVIKRLFLPYKTMAILYPVLLKAPYLLPFCWCARCVEVLFCGKTKRIVSEISCVHHISEEEMKEMEAMLSRLGL